MGFGGQGLGFRVCKERSPSYKLGCKLGKIMFTSSINCGGRTYKNNYVIMGPPCRSREPETVNCKPIRVSRLLCSLSTWSNLRSQPDVRATRTCGP